MTPEVKDALESAEAVLHEALVAYAKDNASLEYTVDDGGQSYCCVCVDGFLMLAVIDPPIHLGEVAREQ